MVSQVIKCDACGTELTDKKSKLTVEAPGSPTIVLDLCSTDTLALYNALPANLQALFAPLVLPS